MNEFGGGRGCGRDLRPTDSRHGHLDPCPLWRKVTRTYEPKSLLLKESSFSGNSKDQFVLEFITFGMEWVYSVNHSSYLRVGMEVSILSKVEIQSTTADWAKWPVNYNDQLWGTQSNEQMTGCAIEKVRMERCQEMGQTIPERPSSHPLTAVWVNKYFTEVQRASQGCSIKWTDDKLCNNAIKEREEVNRIFDKKERVHHTRAPIDTPSTITEHKPIKWKARCIQVLINT